MENTEDKFQFDTEFQENLLQYTVTDKNGHQALKFYEDHYFSLLEHQVIALGLKDYFKHKKRVPQSKAIFREHLRRIFLTKDFINALSAEDRDRINKIVTKIYAKPVKDGDEILNETLKFSRYIQLKDVIESVNLKDFNQYDTFSTKVRKAITLGSELKEQKGAFLIAGIRDRQYRRKFHDEIIPTPFRGINKLTGAGGYAVGSVIVIIGPEKEFKTGLLINIARKLMTVRRRVLYIDLENGQDGMALRFEQSLMNKTKREILSGEFDDKVLKQFRKFSRLGSEVDIKRMASYSTTCDHIQAYIDEQYREFGMRYTDLIVDYGGLLGARSGNKDDTGRISDAYIDLKNLTDHNKFYTCWTANHIVRTAEKRFETKFLSSDIAKCIDIARHVDALYGFNRSEFDKQLGTGRLEVIDQRDGVQNGACIFQVDYEKQRASELSETRAKEYWAQVKLSGNSTSNDDRPQHDKDL